MKPRKKQEKDKSYFKKHPVFTSITLIFGILGIYEKGLWVFLSIFLVFYFTSALSSRCEKCKEHFATELTKTKELNTKIKFETDINSETAYDKYGDSKDIVSENTYPVKITEIEETHTCKHCNHKHKKIKEQKDKNVEFEVRNGKIKIT